MGKARVLAFGLLSQPSFSKLTDHLSNSLTNFFNILLAIKNYLSVLILWRRRLKMRHQSPTEYLDIRMKVFGGLMNITDFFLVFSVAAALSTALARKAWQNIRLNKTRKSITALTAHLSKLKLNLRNQMLKAHMELSFGVQQVPELEYKLRSRLDALSHVDFNDALVFARYFQNLAEIYEVISSFAGPEENTKIVENLSADSFTIDSSPEQKYKCLYVHHKTMVIFTLELLKANETLQLEINKMRSQLSIQGSQTEIKFNIPSYQLHCLSALEHWVTQETTETETEHVAAPTVDLQLVDATP